jgi:hypothetical protein
MLVGKKESGKTEVIKTILQKSIDDKLDNSKIFIFDSGNAYSDWVKQNKGLVISTSHMLKSVFNQPKLISQYSLFCFNGKAFDVDDDVNRLLRELETLFTSPKLSLTKKTLVLDCLDRLSTSPNSQYESFIHNCLNHTISESICVILASHKMPEDSICQAIGNVLLFDQLGSVYPPELKLFFDLDPWKLPPVNTLGVYSSSTGVDHSRFIHVAAQFTKNYQYFNQVKLKKT